jgi:hypothetical protein
MSVIDDADSLGRDVPAASPRRRRYAGLPACGQAMLFRCTCTGAPDAANRQSLPASRDDVAGTHVDEDGPFERRGQVEEVEISAGEAVGK